MRRYPVLWWFGLQLRCRTIIYSLSGKRHSYFYALCLSSPRFSFWGFGVNTTRHFMIEGDEILFLSDCFALWLRKKCDTCSVTSFCAWSHKIDFRPNYITTCCQKGPPEAQLLKDTTNTITLLIKQSTALKCSALVAFAMFTLGLWKIRELRVDEPIQIHSFCLRESQKRINSLIIADKRVDVLWKNESLLP